MASDDSPHRLSPVPTSIAEGGFVNVPRIAYEGIIT
jgi:hypothetical protein